VAIHPIVLGTADRRWRIEADPAGTRFTVQRDGRELATVADLPALTALLAEHGVTLADLTEI